MPDRPRVGDSVWLHGGYQAPDRNGTIIHIDWYDKEVIVGFDNDEQEAVEWEQFSFFNERFNQWIIHI